MTGLIVAGIASGISTAWIFRRTVDAAALRTVMRQIHGRFFEFRLFFDEPRLIWRAQKALVMANFRLCAMLLVPVLIVALPTAWLMMQLDSVYGTAPLRTGEPALATVQLDALQPGDEQSRLEAPDGIAIETPAVRITAEHQIVWRIRPSRLASGNLRFTLRGVVVEKTINPRGFLTRRRERSVLAFLMHPGEARLPAGSGAEWLEIGYPVRDRWWIGWFFAISTAAALVFRKVWN